MAVILKDPDGSARSRYTTLSVLLSDIAPKHTYIVLRQEGRILHVRFGVGPDAMTCSDEFVSGPALSKWINKQVRDTKGQVRGQYITHDHWKRMESAAARSQD